MNQLNLIDICKSTQQQQQKYVFFSSAHTTFFIIGHILGQKTSLNKFKGLKPYKIFFNNHSIKNLEINKTLGKLTNLSKIEHTVQWEIFWDEGKKLYQNLWDTAKKKKVLSGKFIVVSA